MGGARTVGPGKVDRRLPLVVGLIGTAVTVIAARGRFPGIGNDATSYIAVADHVAAGKGLGYFLEPKLGLWPPGWPLVLAGPRWAFDIDPEYTALFINALVPIAIAFLAYSLLRTLVRDDRLVAVGTIVATLGPATVSQYYFVQTEPTFIALTLLAIWALFRFAATHRWSFFALAVITQWVAFMDRYVGLVLIGSASLWLVFDRSFPSWRDRLRNGVLYFVASASVPGLWILRNEIVVGSPFGIRDTPIATYKRNFIDAITSVSQYVHGYSEYQPLVGLARLASLALLAVCGVLALVLLRRAVTSSGRAPSFSTVWEMLGHPVGLLTIYALAHFAYMIYSASTIAFDPVNTRYLVPMFIPSLLVALTIVDRGLPRSEPGAARPAWASGVWALVLVFAVVQVGVGAVRASASYWTDDAQRYNSALGVRIQDSPVFDEIPDDCELLSNFPEFTYLAGVEAQRSPRITKFASPDRQTDLADLHDAVDEGENWCLIWVDEDASEIFYHPSYQYTLGRLQEEFDLEEVAGDDDVTVYRVEASSTP